MSKGISAIGAILALVALLIFSSMIPLINIAMDIGSPYMDEATLVVFSLIPFVIVTMILVGIFRSGSPEPSYY